MERTGLQIQSPASHGFAFEPSSPEIQRYLYYQRQALEDCLRRIGAQESIKLEYDTLKSRLSTIADQTRHSTVVNLGPHALVRAELVHTNEILVFLGDNYFVERTAKQASEIAERRLQNIQQILDKLNEEKRLIENRMDMMSALSGPSGAAGDDIVEIREEIKEDDATNNRTAHVSFKKDLTDQAIEERLDELERQELEEMQFIEEEDEPHPKHLVPPLSTRPRRSSLPGPGSSTEEKKQKRKSVTFAPVEGPVPEREKKKDPMFKKALRMMLAAGKYHSADEDSDSNDWFESMRERSSSHDSVFQKLQRQEKVVEGDESIQNPSTSRSDEPIPVVDTGVIVEKNMDVFEDKLNQMSIESSETSAETKPVSRFKATRNQQR